MARIINKNISKIIFEGPEFIQNVPYSASYDSIIRISKLPYNRSQVNKAYGIFVDNTNNKHRNFLNPIIRITEYSKNNDLPIVIYLKIPKKYFSQMNQLISQIDIRLTQIKFAKAGLILNRIPPKNCIDIWEDFKDNYSLEIYRWNYCQKIDFKFGVQKGKPDKFAKSLIEFINFCETYKNKFSSVTIAESYSDEKSEYLREHQEK